MRSTRYCQSIGIKKKNITSIEKNRNLHNKHLKNGINSYLGDVCENISQSNIYAPYDTLILDVVSSCIIYSEHEQNKVLSIFYVVNKNN